MDYDVYLDKKIIFSHLTEEEAKEKQTQMRRMIFAGIKTGYNGEDIKVKAHS